MESLQINPFDVMGRIAYFYHAQETVACVFCEHIVPSVVMLWGMSVPYGLCDNCVYWMDRMQTKIPYQFMPPYIRHNPSL